MSEKVGVVTGSVDLEIEKDPMGVLLFRECGRLVRER